MAKVTKKQLGRRRRCALYVLLMLLILIIVLVTKCCRSLSPKEPTSVNASLSNTASATEPATTAPVIAGEIYTGTAPIINEYIESTPQPTMPSEPENLPDEYQIQGVTPILQNPELPTGCEITSLTMALNYAGYATDKLTMADKYLIRAEPYQTTFGEAFVGSPHDPTAWGCYAPVIVKTAQRFLTDMNGTEDTTTVQNLTGCSLKTLLGEVANGTPVITWASIGMTDDIEERYYWTTPEGKDAVFLVSEHCLLLTGYSIPNSTVTVCDPLEGQTTYDMEVFEDRYNRLYQQAVVIRSNASSKPEDENINVAVDE